MFLKLSFHPNYWNCLVFVFLILSSINENKSAKTSSFIDSMKHEIVIVNPKNFDSLINRHRNKSGVSVLLHYSSKEIELKRFINDIYDETAQELKGMARFGAINCAEWSDFCKKNGNPNLTYPFVQIFPPNPLPVKSLSENIDKKNLISSVIKFIPGTNVKTITTVNIDSFLNEDAAIPKVLLFSSKEEIPVMFKALGNAFSDRMNFGYVGPNEPLIRKKYKIQSSPKILIIKADLKKPEAYEGKLKYMAVHDWLNIRAETFVKGGGFSHDTDVVEASPKPWLDQKVPELTGTSYQDICFKTTSLCVLYLSKGGINDKTTEELEKISDKFTVVGDDRGVSFRFAYIDLNIEKEFLKTFNVKKENLPSLVVLNTHKRLRYITLPENKKPTTEEITNLLEKIASGDSRFTVIKGQKFPSFAPRFDDKSKAIPKKQEL